MRTKGVNAAAWFYAQPGFHAPTRQEDRPMKRFQGIPGDGPAFYDGDTLAYADGTTFANPGPRDDAAAAYAAEVEARAILVETEPPVGALGLYWGDCFPDHCEYRTTDGTPSEWQVALAEALAAFVADEGVGQ